MMLVKTEAAPSAIHGIGCFAAEFIPKGTLVWRLDPTVDEIYHAEEVELLPEPKRSEILGLFHSYKSKEIHKYVLCGDDARYFNHADSPNVIEVPASPGEESVNIAARDIQKGEELTYDYRGFDEEFSFIA